MDKQESKVKKWFKDHKSIIIVGGTAVGLTLIGYILGRASMASEVKELDELNEKAFWNGSMHGWAAVYFVSPEATKEALSHYRSSDERLESSIRELEDYISKPDVSAYFKDILTKDVK